jgi:hypothetical protein
MRIFGMKQTKRIIALIVTSALFLSINNVADAAKKAKAPATGPTGNFVYRYENGQQQRLDSARKWQKKDSRKANNFDPIRVAAYKSITSLPTDSSHANIEFEDQIRAGFPKEIAELIRFQSKEVAKRFSPLFDTKVKIKLIGVTEKDQDFVKNDLPKIVNENGYGGPFILDLLKDYVSLQRFYSRAGTGGGSAGYEDDKGYAYYLAHTSTLAKTETYWPEVAPHEMTHVLQGVLTRDSGNPAREGDPKSKVAGHYIEGSANTIGMALGFANVGWYSDEMDKLLSRDIKYFKGKVSVKSKAEAVALIKLIEARDDETSSQLSYSAGQIVWEYFIGTYGMAKYVEFLKNMKSTENFNANLVKTIGKDREAFYSEAADYLYKTWQRLS